MKYLKVFESFNNETITDIKVSEGDKLKNLPGFNFYRTNVLGNYEIHGRREKSSMESISISKYTNNNFNLHIRRSPGYFQDLPVAGSKGWEESWDKKEWDLYFKFENIDDLKKFLLEYKWYDVLYYN
jgi:hypothetical protein